MGSPYLGVDQRLLVAADDEVAPVHCVPPLTCGIDTQCTKLLQVEGGHNAMVRARPSGVHHVWNLITFYSGLATERRGVVAGQEDAVGEHLSASLGVIARTLQSEPDVESTLVAIVKAAVEHVEGAEYAGISLVERRHKIRTVAPTSELVVTIDEVQYRTGQGPCVDAIADHQVYRTGDLTAETRWPAFAPQAAATGGRSMLSYRLFVTDTTLGALNLYSRTVDAFSDQTDEDGRMFATHAAIALAGAQIEAGLSAAIEHRDVIGMAKGILMHHHDVDAVQAFRLLVEYSQHTNMKLHQVATWLVEHRREL